MNIRRAGVRTARRDNREIYSCEPTILGPQLSLWLRSSVGVTQVSNKVSQWSDPINGINFVQGTGARQPDYLASDPNFNGLPSISTLATEANLRASAHTITIQHVLIVANQPAGVFAGLDFRTLLVAAANALMGITGSANWRVSGLAIGTRFRDGSVTNEAIAAPNRAHVYECAWSAPLTSAGGWFLGGDPGDPSREWGGGIVEVIASNQLIPDRTARGLRQMLRTRYGTP